MTTRAEKFLHADASKVHEVDNVRFQSTLIHPIAVSGKAVQRDGYPLVIWFGGMGPSGLHGLGVEFAELSRATSEPFVLVVPFRPSETWWVLDDGGHPWGCVTGSLLTGEVDKYCRWIQTLAGTSGIDRTSVSLFGGSAGAYAISEIIAAGTCALHCVGLVAVHGHGRPDLDGLDEECKTRSDDIMGKWTAYIKRISKHRTTPNILIGVHNEKDTCWPWKYAREIYTAFYHGRQWPSTIQVLATKKQTPHNYGPEAMNLFLQHAFGVPALSNNMFEPMRLSVSGRAALPSEDGVILGSSSDQSFGHDRSRSRQRKQRPARTEHQKPGLHVAPEVVHGKADPVVTLPRCSVGQDGPLPVDHIGRLTLGSGMQGLYIVYSDTVAEDLWSSASYIGQSLDLKFFDSDEENALCASVRNALSTTGNQLAEDFFMCTIVGDVVAVGFGPNKKKRTKTTRIAAAVFAVLQEITPVEEFACYPKLQSLIKQVKSVVQF